MNNYAEVLATNLRRLRKARGLSQKELARLAGLSVTGYRNLENLRLPSEPKVSTLMRIAEGLGVGLEDLLRPVPVLHAVRFRAQKKMKRREQVLADVACWLRDYNFLEDLLGDRRHSPFGSAIAKLAQVEPGPQRAKDAAERVRRALGLNRDEPIHDICGLLESHGVKVLAIRLESQGFFGLAIGESDGGPAVVVNTHPSIPVERWIFSAAHELGHIILHEDAFDVRKEDENPEEEREANQFASSFLMPDRAFTKEWSETQGMDFYDRVLKVKRIFRVSYKTVLWRCSESKNVSYRDVIVRFQQRSVGRSGTALGRADEPSSLDAASFHAKGAETERSREPESLSEKDFMEDRLSLLVRRAIEKGEITFGRAAEILGVSYEEMRRRALLWERPIL
jgi:Zn-dependent peptidase ImmA (M78 family)/transcriptional regulator with XRE-family HTH domain